MSLPFWIAALNVEVETFPLFFSFNKNTCFKDDFPLSSRTAKGSVLNILLDQWYIATDCNHRGSSGPLLVYWVRLYGKL